jgi:hypothetical protein
VILKFGAFDASYEEDERETGAWLRAGRVTLDERRDLLAAEGRDLVRALLVSPGVWTPAIGPVPNGRYCEDRAP